MYLTKRERDCLMVIGDNKNDFPIRLSDISKKMKLSAPTVYNLLKRLKDKGLINENRGLVIITSFGKEIHSNIIFAHRCLECLFNEIGLDKKFSCNEASKIDYLLNNELIIKLYNHIGRPKTCPHGKPLVV